MDEETKLKLCEMQAEMRAILLVTQEALSVALSHDANPDRAVSLARKDLGETLSKTLREAETSQNSEFRTWFVGLVQKSVTAQMDSVEKRVSTLTRGRITH